MGYDQTNKTDQAGHGHRNRSQQCREHRVEQLNPSGANAAALRRLLTEQKDIELRSIVTSCQERQGDAGERNPGGIPTRTGKAAEKEKYYRFAVGYPGV